MSDVSDLKQKLGALAQQASSTAQALASFKTKFSEQVSGVSQTAGGSAQRVDATTIEMLQAAEKKVDEAMQALQAAGRAVSTYGASL